MSRKLSLVLLPVVVLSAATLVAAADDSESAPADFLDRMAIEHTGDTPVASAAASTEPAAAVAGGPVDYAEIEGAAISGYLARPADGKPTAGVLLIHEWWGLNDNIRAVADRFAGEGYLALAVDLYEGESADDREGAMRLATAARDRPERLTENLRQAAAYLESQGVTSLGTIGWCFGGSWSLRAGLALGSGVDAVVIYYGRVPSDREELAGLEAPVLGHFGEADGGIPVDSVRAFETALDELGKTATIHIYEGAGHAFANPSGTRYQPEAAETAWERTLEFFAEELR